jgi:hypothetical protein
MCQCMCYVYVHVVPPISNTTKKDPRILVTPFAIAETLIIGDHPSFADSGWDIHWLKQPPIPPLTPHPSECCECTTESLAQLHQSLLSLITRAESALSPVSCRSGSK